MPLGAGSSWLQVVHGYAVREAPGAAHFRATLVDQVGKGTAQYGPVADPPRFVGGAA